MKDTYCKCRLVRVINSDRLVVSVYLGLGVTANVCIHLTPLTRSKDAKLLPSCESANNSRREFALKLMTMIRTLLEDKEFTVITDTDYVSLNSYYLADIRYQHGIKNESLFWRLHDTVYPNQKQNT